VGGVNTVTGLSGMTVDSEGGTIWLYLSPSQHGFFKILQFVDATSVRVRNVPFSGAGVEWRETPRPPYISETQVALKNLDGTPASIGSGGPKRFRVVRAGAFKAEIQKLRYWYCSAPLEHVLEGRHYGFGNSVDGEWRDLFTPGMVGMSINLSESLLPTNDGKFLITKYYNSGRVGIESTSTSDEFTRGQRGNIRRAP